MSARGGPCLVCAKRTMQMHRYDSSPKIGCLRFIKKMAWRSHDRPLIGTIFRLPDDPSLVRGVTFTILPEGRKLRVPVMHRQDVRAQNEAHTQNESHDIVQALQDIIQGRKPVPGRARLDHQGHGQSEGDAAHVTEFKDYPAHLSSNLFPDRR